MVSQRDTTFTKIFVGGLPYHTTDETLRKFFERFGDIEEAVVITDRATGKSRGYGFVTMSTKEGAQEAIKDPNPVIDGRKANVNLAYLGAKPRTALSAANAANTIIHLGAAYPTLQTYGLQPIIYPAHTLLGSNGIHFATSAASAGASLSPTTQAAHYATTASAYDLAAQFASVAQMDTNAASAYSYGNALTTAALAAAAAQNQQTPANATQLANSYYAALATQAITTGATYQQ